MGIHEIPNTTLILEAALLSRPKSQVVAATHCEAAVTAGDWGWLGWLQCSLRSGYWPRHLPSPTAHASARVRQGSASGSVQVQSKHGELRSEPNFKVMEDSQDRHEGMNFKHVLLCFKKLKP